MSVKDISDEQVIRAYIDSRKLSTTGNRIYPYELLIERTGQCGKVCYRAMERAASRGFIDYGVSLRSGWPTDKGLHKLTPPTEQGEYE